MEKPSEGWYIKEESHITDAYMQSLKMFKPVAEISVTLSLNTTLSNFST
jgi:hypothetical protein